MSAAKSDSLDRLVRIVSRYDGITAGKAGFECWYRPGNEVRHENTCATMHCRAAGKLLARAERLGLVRHRQYGPAKLWYANAEGESRAASARTLHPLVVHPDLEGGRE